MGNSTSQFEQRFNTNYGFIQAINDPIYGMVKVYRKKFENYHYVMLIQRRLQEFKKETLISACITPQRDTYDVLIQVESNNMDSIPRILHNSDHDYYREQNSMKLQRLKRTLELIKRHQNELFIPFFSYRILQGSKFECSEPVIQLYVEYHNHRLLEYLDVLRGKGLQLKVNQIVYILKTVCLAIMLLAQMQIHVTVKQINVKSIYTTNEGEVKLHPIEIITKKQQQTQAISYLETLQTNNPIIELSKFNHNNNQRSASTKTDKLSNQRHSKSSLPKQRNGLMSSNQSQSPFSTKLNAYKEILIKLLIQLSPYTLSKSAQNKELLKINLIITRASSINSIYQKLQKFENPCLEGLLVQRIYDLNQRNNNSKQENVQLSNKLRKNSQHNDKLSASNMSNFDHNLNLNPGNVDNKPNKFKNIKSQNTQFQITQVHKFSIQKTNQNINSANYSESGKFSQSFSTHKKPTQNQHYASKVSSNQQNVRYEVLNRISQMSQMSQHFPSGISRPNIHNKDPISTVKNSLHMKGVNTQKGYSPSLLNNFVQEQQKIMQNPSK